MGVFRQQAVDNFEQYGDQTWATWALATGEELGELCQATLHYYYEGGDAERIPEELVDLVALFYAAYWKHHDSYPVAEVEDYD